jgi:hypothetical protein
MNPTKLMKNLLIGILLLTTIAFGSLYFTQNRKTSEAQAQLATIQEKLVDAETRVAKQEEKTASLQTRLHETREKAVAKADQVIELQAITNQLQTNARSANPIAQMFKTPEMRDLIKNQQKIALSGLVDKNYGDFFSSLGLTSEKSAALKDLILKKSLIGAQMGVSLMGDIDSEKRQELIKQSKVDTDEVDKQIKEFLGQENYPQFETYEKTIPDRMMVNMFKEQQASGAGALSPEQESRLLQALGDERQNFKFSTDFSDRSKLSADPTSFFTDEKISKFQEESAQLQDRYVARANNILAPEQLEPFQKFLVGQREMQSAGMKMAMQLFGQKNSN